MSNPVDTSKAVFTVKLVIEQKKGDTSNLNEDSRCRLNQSIEVEKMFIRKKHIFCFGRIRSKHFRHQIARTIPCLNITF